MCLKEKKGKMKKKRLSMFRSAMDTSDSLAVQISLCHITAVYLEIVTDKSVAASKIPKIYECVLDLT